MLGVLTEVYRVLKKPRNFGENSCFKFILISGNDTFLLHPYLYQFNWNVDVQSIQRRHSREQTGSTAFSKLNMFLYVMTVTGPTNTGDHK